MMHCGSEQQSIRIKYRASRLSIRWFARTAHSLTPELVENKCLMLGHQAVLDHSVMSNRMEKDECPLNDKPPAQK